MAKRMEGKTYSWLSPNKEEGIIIKRFEGEKDYLVWTQHFYHKNGTVVYTQPNAFKLEFFKNPRSGQEEVGFKYPLEKEPFFLTEFTPNFKEEVMV